jgi:hypothetical protein
MTASRRRRRTVPAAAALDSSVSGRTPQPRPNDVDIGQTIASRHIANNRSWRNNREAQE